MFVVGGGDEKETKPVRRRTKRDLEPITSGAHTSAPGKRSSSGEGMMPSYDADSSDDDIPDFSGHDEMLDLAAGGGVSKRDDEFLPDEDLLDFTD